MDIELLHRVVVTLYDNNVDATQINIKGRNTKEVFASFHGRDLSFVNGLCLRKGWTFVPVGDSGGFYHPRLRYKIVTGE